MTAQVHYVCPNGCPVGVWLKPGTQAPRNHFCERRPHPKFHGALQPRYVALVAEHTQDQLLEVNA